jgi:hypothetical protein
MPIQKAAAQPVSASLGAEVRRRSPVGLEHAGYERDRDLPRLLPLWPHEVETSSVSEHARLLARMRRALRIERQRGLAGHWAYDLARHAQLLRAYRAETADYLRRIGEGRAPGTPKD